MLVNAEGARLALTDEGARASYEAATGRRVGLEGGVRVVDGGEGGAYTADAMQGEDKWWIPTQAGEGGEPLKWGGWTFIRLPLAPWYFVVPARGVARATPLGEEEGEGVLRVVRDLAAAGGEGGRLSSVAPPEGPWACLDLETRAAGFIVGDARELMGVTAATVGGACAPYFWVERAPIPWEYNRGRRAQVWEVSAALAAADALGVRGGDRSQVAMAGATVSGLIASRDWASRDWAPGGEGS